MGSKVRYIEIRDGFPRILINEAPSGEPSYLVSDALYAELVNVPQSEWAAELLAHKNSRSWLRKAWDTLKRGI